MGTLRWGMAAGTHRKMSVSPVSHRQLTNQTNVASADLSCLYSRGTIRSNTDEYKS